MEVGKLTVPVSADLGPIQRDLDRLRTQLGQANNQTHGVTNAMRGMERQTISLTAALRPFAAALAGALSFRALTQMTDAWSTMNWQLRNATGSGEKAAAVMERLNQIARSTWSPVQQVTESYIRQTSVMQALGYSTEQQLVHTEALNAAILISGLRGQRAESVATAWQRAMAAGALRGMEFNTVVENSSRLTELLAQKLGVSVPELRNLAKEGRITSDVMYGITESIEDLRKELEGDASFSGALILIGNSLMKVVGELDKAAGASSTLGSALVWVADNMERVLSSVAAGVGVWAAYTAGLAAVNAGLFTSVGAVNALRVAWRRLLLSTVVGALVVAIGELITQIWYARQAAESWGEAFRDLWERSKAIVTAFGYFWESEIAKLASDWKTMLADIAEASETVLSYILRIFGVSAESISGYIANLRREAELALALGEASAELGRIAWSHATRPRESGGGSTLDDGGGPRLLTPEIDDRKARRLAEAYKRIVDDSVEFIRSQELERQAIGMTDLEAAKLRARFDLLNQARRAGIELTPDEVAAFEALGDAMAEAEHKTRQLQERYDFAKDTFKGFFTDLKTELQNGASLWEAFGTAAANALQKIADKALDMALNGIFDMIFGAFSGGGGGGFLSRLFKFENGTSFAPGGWSVVGERGPELLKLPAGSQVMSNNRVTAPPQASFGTHGSGGDHGPREINVYVSGARGNAEIREMVMEGVRDGLADYDAHILPGSMERIRDHPRMR